MANYYIDSSGSGDGSSAAAPAANFPSPLVDGTTYLINGGTTLNRGASTLTLTSKSNITIGSYGTGKAIITANSGVILITLATAGTNITIQDLILSSAGSNATMYLNGTTTGTTISNVDFIQPVASDQHQILFAAGHSHDTLSISDISFTNGQRGISYLCTKASTTMTGWTIDGLVARGLLDHVIRITTETTNNAHQTTVINNLSVRNVNIDECYGGIWLRFGDTTDPWNPYVRSDNVLVENCTVQNTANYTTFLDIGGITVRCVSNSTIQNNTVYNVTTKGGAIQTLGCNALVIQNNYCEHAVSVALSGGLYIDSVGIFCDQGNQNCIVRHNTIVDCPGYNIVNDPALMAANSGGGISLWNNGNNKVYGNIIKDSRYGFSYGHANETGNMIFNNTDIGCSSASLKKSGTQILTGNITQQNNVSIGSATLLSYSGTSYCTDGGGNELFATADAAGIRLDGNGIPQGPVNGSACADSGTDLSAYYEDANGVPYYSPPNKGAYSTRKGVIEGWGIFR